MKNLNFVPAWVPNGNKKIVVLGQVKFPKGISMMGFFLKSISPKT